MKKRQRRSPAEWQALLKAQRDSQLSVTEFCRQQSLDVKYFSKRKRAYETQAATSAQSRFIKIQTTPQPSQVSNPELVLHHQNTRLVFHAGVDTRWVADLMRALS